MARIITFSTTFPSYHPRRGELTYFREKLLIGFGLSGYDMKSFPITLDYKSEKEWWWAKYHTIRAGNRWKVGDMFSPRVWSGKPYNSKQIIIAPDIEVMKIWDFEIIKAPQLGKDVLLLTINKTTVIE